MALIVAVGLSVFGQMTGVNRVVYEGPAVLKDAGFESAAALQWQVVLGIVNLTVTLVAIWKVDHWGRRQLLVCGMARVSFALAATDLLLLVHAPAGWVVFLLCAYP
ncbi:MAG: MFS transporter [Pirellulaceae bacterium]